MSNNQELSKTPDHRAPDRSKKTTQEKSSTPVFLDGKADIDTMRRLQELASKFSIPNDTI